MKRFYKLVSVKKESSSFSVLLDGKPVKTPAKSNLIAPNEGVANLVLQEWAAQEGEIKPNTMPVTQILVTAQDIIVKNRTSVEQEILEFTDTDLICYRSESEPYAGRQQEIWHPCVELLEKNMGIEIAVTSNLQCIRQNGKVRSVFADFVQGCNDLRLTLLQSLLDDSGSLILSILFMKQLISPTQIYEAILVDDLIRAEIYNEDLYGAAPDQEKKRTSLKRNFAAAENLLQAL